MYEIHLIKRATWNRSDCNLQTDYDGTPMRQSDSDKNVPIEFPVKYISIDFFSFSKQTFVLKHTLLNVINK